jgi:hypothetical protein
MSARTATAVADEMRLDRGSLDQLFVERMDNTCGPDRLIG